MKNQTLEVVERLLARSPQDGKGWTAVRVDLTKTEWRTLKAFAKAHRPVKTQSARFHRLFDRLSAELAATVQNEGECLMAAHMLAGLCLSAAMNATGGDRTKSRDLVVDAVNSNLANFGKVKGQP